MKRMKTNFSKTALIMGVSFLLMAGCNRSSKVSESKGTTSDGKEASVEVEVFDAMKLKDQIVEVIENAPRAEEIAGFINEAGASYILDLTVPIDDAEKFMTKTQKSLGLGMYTFDMNYAKAFNRGDRATQIGDLSLQMLNDLGLQEDFSASENHLERLKQNAGNKDSVDYIVTDMMNYSHQQFSASDQPGTYALTFIGANVEAMYILSQLSLFAENNQPMIDFLAQQGERAKSVYSLLELMSGDETVQPYYEKMKPIADYFDEHQAFTQKELEEISPMIEALREEIF